MNSADKLKNNFDYEISNLKFLLTLFRLSNSLVIAVVLKFTNIEVYSMGCGKFM